MSKTNKATFNDLKEFFLSWGLWPALEEHDEEMNIGNANNEYIINGKCYERMCREAEEKYGETFRSFVSRVVDATDGEFYLSLGTWNEILDCWEDAL